LRLIVPPLPSARRSVCAAAAIACGLGASGAARSQLSRRASRVASANGQ
jgi:hypothetical protein